MNLFNPLKPYLDWIKLGAFIAICAACYMYGGSNAKAKAERACLAKENKALTQAVSDNAKANDERRVAQATADKLAALPPKVVTVARANPSGCSIAKPVGDELRKQIAETNAAIRSMP